MITGLTNWLLLFFGTCCVGGLVAYTYVSSPPKMKLEFSVPTDTIYIISKENQVLAKGEAQNR